MRRARASAGRTGPEHQPRPRVRHPRRGTCRVVTGEPTSTSTCATSPAGNMSRGDRPRPGLVLTPRTDAGRRYRTPARSGAVGVRARAATERGLCPRLSADSLRTLHRVPCAPRRRWAVAPLAFTMFPCSVFRLYQLRYNQGIRRLGSAGRFGNADCSLCARCELRSIPPDRALTAKSSGRSVPFSPSARTLRSMWPRS